MAIHAFSLIRTISGDDIDKVTASTEAEVDTWSFGNMLHQEALRARHAGDYARARHFEAELTRFASEPQVKMADPDRAIEMVTASFEAFTTEMEEAYDAAEEAYALATLPCWGF